MSDRDHLYDRKRLLLESALDEPDQFRASRRLGALAAALTGVAAGGAQLGCLEGDDEYLGAWGGAKDIPAGLRDMQQWSGSLTNEVTATRPGKNMVRIQLPEEYARDWTVQIMANTPPNVAVGIPSTQAAELQVRWGHHGSVETVLMDFPTRGGSFTVHGAYLEVAVFDPGTPAGTVTANYQVWVNEGSSARNSPPPFQPVFTSHLGTLAIGAIGVATAPARARAFYITAVPGAAAATPFELRLTDNVAVRAFYEIEVLSGANAPRMSDMLQNPWVFPPQCNLAVIENLTGAVMDAVDVHWLLDLGS